MRNPRSTSLTGSRLAGMGIELAATVAGACLLGYWIDRRFQTGPWGLVVCSLLGITGGLYNLIRHAVRETVMSPPCGRKKNDQDEHEVQP